MPTNDEGKETKRVMITILAEDYHYCKTHFVKLSPICEQALSKYIAWEREKIELLKKEIPANCDKKDRIL